MKYEWVYRCVMHEEHDYGCGWETSWYSEVDDHESQSGVHFVTGEIRAMEETR